MNLCASIQKIYSPGARIIICSDGRVFSDMVGMKDEYITDYQQELDLIIADLQLTNISTFNLDQLYTGTDFNKMREDLLQIFGEPISLLQEKVKRGSAAQAGVK